MTKFAANRTLRGSTLAAAETHYDFPNTLQRLSLQDKRGAARFVGINVRKRRLPDSPSPSPSRSACREGDAQNHQRMNKSAWNYAGTSYGDGHLTAPKPKEEYINGGEFKQNYKKIKKALKTILREEASAQETILREEASAQEEAWVKEFEEERSAMENDWHGNQDAHVFADFVLQALEEEEALEAEERDVEASQTDDESGEDEDDNQLADNSRQALEGKDRLDEEVEEDDDEDDGVELEQEQEEESDEDEEEHADLFDAMLDAAIDAHERGIELDWLPI